MMRRAFVGSVLAATALAAAPARRLWADDSKPAAIPAKVSEPINLDAYFGRIGYRGPRAATLQVLRERFLIDPPAGIAAAFSKIA